MIVEIQGYWKKGAPWKMNKDTCTIRVDLKELTRSTNTRSRTSGSFLPVYKDGLVKKIFNYIGMNCEEASIDPVTEFVESLNTEKYVLMWQEALRKGKRL